MNRLITAVDGIPVHGVTWTGPEPPVVLVHGLALSGRYMMPLARALAPRHRVLLPDLPGFGDSGKPRRILDVPGLADMLAAWMEAMHLGPSVLVGNSFACQIILDLAARHPSLVAGGILQGPTTPPNERTWVHQFVRWRQNSKYNPPEMGDIAHDDYLKCGYVRALVTFHYSLVDRPEEKLPRVRAPMVVVRGQLDPICHEWWAAEVAQELPDGRHIEIPAVAHTLCFTAPEQMAWVVDRFLG